MNAPVIDTQLDQSWHLQGRVIPPSCTSGDGCILHLQAKLHSWANEHFHTGRLSINSEVGLEFAMSMLVPVEEGLVRESLDYHEQKQEVEYLLIAKLFQPEDSIAFPTINGLTLVINSKGLNTLFGVSEKCANCKAQESTSLLIPPHSSPSQFDSLMQITSDEKSH